MRRTLTACVGVALMCLITQAALAHDSGFGLARYTPGGTLDTSFGAGGVVVIRSAQRSFVANALALQPDGKIVLAGMSSDVASGSLQLAIALYNGDGSPDEGFSSGGLVTTPVGAGAGAQASSVALQADGKILIAGTAFAHGETNDEFLIARFTPAGALDSSFGTGGMTTTHIGAAAAAASALALQPDGNVIAVGTASTAALSRSTSARPIRMPARRSTGPEPSRSSRTRRSWLLASRAVSATHSPSYASSRMVVWIPDSGLAAKSSLPPRSHRCSQWCCSQPGTSYSRVAPAAEAAQLRSRWSGCTPTGDRMKPSAMAALPSRASRAVGRERER